ncbi:hypothetical protein NE237_013015 [Protea cynaroides]|uniref:F-box domain-containing protein n=1 Tax=Protea cynaroides TaxID=273540 RepID=A0A9Q0H261_9MAGN|nr:hypothetical protein NE237_013015 [Protea cynaroides]
MEQEGNTDLSVLPESCIVDIFSRICTSPRDACRLSAVSLIFQSAADSDSIWERFFPSDVQLILSSSVSQSLPDFSSKKEQFLYLCDNPLLVENGTMTFALEKCSGKKCYMIGARELFLFWGYDPKSWKWPSLPESRFSEVAELLGMGWLEIRGKMETRLLSPNTTYVIYLVYKLTVLANGLQYKSRVTVNLVSCGRSKQQGREKSVFLHRPVESKLGRELPDERDANSVPVFTENKNSVPVEVPQERGDGWMEIVTDVDGGGSRATLKMTEFVINDQANTKEEVYCESVRQPTYRASSCLQAECFEIET